MRCPTVCTRFVGDGRMIINFEAVDFLREKLQKAIPLEERKPLLTINPFNKNVAYSLGDEASKTLYDKIFDVITTQPNWHDNFTASEIHLVLWELGVYDEMACKLCQKVYGGIDLPKGLFDNLVWLKIEDESEESTDD
jgi:hypothetical protein